MDRQSAGFLGALIGMAVAFGLACVSLPICMFSGVAPHVWGSLSIGAIPVVSLAGYFIGYARAANHNM